MGYRGINRKQDTAPMQSQSSNELFKGGRMISGRNYRMACIQVAFSCAFQLTDSSPLANPASAPIKDSQSVLLKGNFHLPVQMWCKFWSLPEQDTGLASLMIPTEMALSCLSPW